MKILKNRVALAAVLALAVLGGVAWSKRAPQIVPLQTPTEAQFAKIFTGDSRQILEGSDHLFLYSLAAYGKPDETYEAGYFGDEWRSLGHVAIGDAKTKAALLAAFLDGIAQGKTRALCFEPRHGLRATRNGKTIDFVICFHCLQMQIYDGSTENPPYVAISNAPKKFFDDLLSANGIALSQ